MNRKSNLNEIYGYLLLADEGLIVYNPKYVSRYGCFMREISLLKNNSDRSNYKYLLESYTNSAMSAKFFATYPADLTDKTPHELRLLRMNSK